MRFCDIPIFLKIFISINDTSVVVDPREPMAQCAYLLISNLHSKKKKIIMPIKESSEQAAPNLLPSYIIEEKLGHFRNNHLPQGSLITAAPLG